MPINVTGKVAGSFVDALKSHPLLLVLSVTNFACLGFIYFQSSQFASMRQENVKLFIEQQIEFNKLLAKCIVPENKTSWRPPFKLPVPFVPIKILGEK